MEEEYPLVLWPGDPKPPHRLRFSLQAVLFATMVFSLWIGWTTFLRRTERFDQAAWSAPDSIQWGVRKAMADGLIRRNELTGMSQKAVYKKLGPPDSPKGFRIMFQFQPVIYSSINRNDWLMITFDGDHKVEKAIIY